MCRFSKRKLFALSLFLALGVFVVFYFTLQGRQDPDWIEKMPIDELQSKVADLFRKAIRIKVEELDGNEKLKEYVIRNSAQCKLIADNFKIVSSEKLYNNSVATTQRVKIIIDGYENLNMELFGSSLFFDYSGGQFQVLIDDEFPNSLFQVTGSEFIRHK